MQQLRIRCGVLRSCNMSALCVQKLSEPDHLIMDLIHPQTSNQNSVEPIPVVQMQFASLFM